MKQLLLAGVVFFLMIYSKGIKRLLYMKVLGESGMDVLVEEIKKRSTGGDGADGAINHLIPWEYLISNEPYEAWFFYRTVCQIYGMLPYLTEDDFTGPNKLDILNSDNAAGGPMSGGPVPISWKSGFATVSIEHLLRNLIDVRNSQHDKITQLETFQQKYAVLGYAGKLCKYLCTGSAAGYDMRALVPIDDINENEFVQNYIYMGTVDITNCDYSNPIECARDIMDNLKTGAGVCINLINSNNSCSKHVLLYAVGDYVYGVVAPYVQIDFDKGLCKIITHNGIPYCLVQRSLFDGAKYTFKLVFYPDDQFVKSSAYATRNIHEMTSALIQFSRDNMKSL